MALGLFRLAVSKIELAKTELRNGLSKGTAVLLGLEGHLLEDGHGLLVKPPQLEPVQKSGVGVVKLFLIAVVLMVGYEFPVGFKKSFPVIGQEELLHPDAAKGVLFTCIQRGGYGNNKEKK